MLDWTLATHLAGWTRKARAARERQALRDLPDRLLRDIGVRRGDL